MHCREEPGEIHLKSLFIDLQYVQYLQNLGIKSNIDMNAVGNLKINKWHVGSYSHLCTSSPAVGFNGRFKVVENSDG